MPKLSAVSADPERFAEAVEWFRAKTPLTADSYYAIQGVARDRAFTISGSSDLDLISFVLREIDATIEGGKDFRDFEKRVTERLVAGWGGSVANPGHRIETIYRTNLQTAFSRARQFQLDDPLVKQLRPGRLFDAIRDLGTTQICTECDGTIVDADDPWLDTHTPPLHHKCRSRIRSLRRSQVDRRGGYQPSHKLPTIPPDDGFGTRPRSAADILPNLQLSLDGLDPELTAEFQNKARAHEAAATAKARQEAKDRAKAEAKAKREAAAKAQRATKAAEAAAAKAAKGAARQEAAAAKRAERAKRQAEEAAAKAQGADTSAAAFKSSNVRCDDITGVQACAKLIFGRKVSPADINALVGTGRIDGECRIGLMALGSREIHMSASIVRDGRQVAKIERAIKRTYEGKVVAHHELMEIAEDLQGGGIGRQIFADQIATYSTFGVEKVTTEAAWVGRYTWPRLGFELRNPSELEDLKSRFGAWLASDGVLGPDDAAKMVGQCGSVRDLAMLRVGERRVGREWLTEKTPKQLAGEGTEEFKRRFQRWNTTRAPLVIDMRFDVASADAIAQREAAETASAIATAKAEAAARKAAEELAQREAEVAAARKAAEEAAARRAAEEAEKARQAAEEERRRRRAEAEARRKAAEEAERIRKAAEEAAAEESTT